MQILTSAPSLPITLVTTSKLSAASVLPDAPSSVESSAAAASSAVSARTTLLAPTTLASLFSAPPEAVATGGASTQTSSAINANSGAEIQNEANPSLTTGDIAFIHAATGVNFVRASQGGGRYLDDNGAPVTGDKLKQAIELTLTVNLDRSRGAISGDITQVNFDDILARVSNAARLAESAGDENSGMEPLDSSITNAADAWFSAQAKATDTETDVKAGG